MNKDRIIERLILEVECLTELLESEGFTNESSINLLNDLEKNGFKSFLPFSKQTAEDKEYIRKLLEEDLFIETEDTKDPWAWVKTEYCAMFKAKNPKRGGYIKESVSRMKKMFAGNPEIRKEDVIGTVKLYLSQTDSRYIRAPHYFLKKGVGVNAVYEFDTWYEKYLEAKEAGKGRNSPINTIQ